VETRLALLEQQMRMHTEECLLDRQTRESHFTNFMADTQAQHSAFQERMEALRRDFQREMELMEKRSVAALDKMSTALNSFDTKLWGIIALAVVAVLTEIVKAIAK
jgi:hypothetical protein